VAPPLATDPVVVLARRAVGQPRLRHSELLHELFASLAREFEPRW